MYNDQLFDYTCLPLTMRGTYWPVCHSPSWSPSLPLSATWTYKHMDTLTKRRIEKPPYVVQTVSEWNAVMMLRVFCSGPVETVASVTAGGARKAILRCCRINYPMFGVCSARCTDVLSGDSESRLWYHTSQSKGERSQAPEAGGKFAQPALKRTVRKSYMNMELLELPDPQCHVYFIVKSSEICI